MKLWLKNINFETELEFNTEHPFAFLRTRRLSTECSKNYAESMGMDALVLEDSWAVNYNKRANIIKRVYKSIRFPI